jgi:hypothetical protein
LSKTLIAVVDAEARGYLCNSETGAVLHRFRLSQRCQALEFRFVVVVVYVTTLMQLMHYD